MKSRQYPYQIAGMSPTVAGKGGYPCRVQKHTQTIWIYPPTTILGLQGKLPNKWQDKTNYNAKAGIYESPQISAGEMDSFLLEDKLLQIALCSIRPILDSEQIGSFACTGQQQSVPVVKAGSSTKVSQDILNQSHTELVFITAHQQRNLLLLSDIEPIHGGGGDKSSLFNKFDIEPQPTPKG